jgi:NAD-dependent dihydropyrimidine dehydrogenase PreA subunit
MKYLANVSTLAYSRDKCTGCGRCVEVCPQGVFEMRDKKAEVIDSDLCMECGACAMNCEFDAITVNSGVGCAAAIINGMITGGATTCDCGVGGSNCCG